MIAIESLAAIVERFGDCRLDEPLFRHTTFGVGGPADVYLTVREGASLAGAVTAAREAAVDVFVLGSGSNILVSDAGIRGLVIDNRSRTETASGTTVRIETGASFAGFARRMCRLGFAGLAWAVGIPGTVGGAVVYNAGAYGGCLADVLLRVRLLEPGGALEWVDAQDLRLVYRGSALTRGQLTDRTAIEAELRLSPGDATDLLAEAARYDSSRLAAQPRGRNAGSTFKNTADYPAWKLIDAVGLRGARRGDAGISEKHCNFFVNYRNARAADVAWLIREAERRVYDRFGVRLEREIALVGEWS